MARMPTSDPEQIERSDFRYTKTLMTRVHHDITGVKTKAENYSQGSKFRLIPFNIKTLFISVVEWVDEL